MKEPSLQRTKTATSCFPLNMLIFGKVITTNGLFLANKEIDLSKDMAHWETLTNKEKYFIKMILAFFAASDGIVIENLGQRFMSEVQISEARAAYGFQLMMENIHSETYSLLIDTYIKDREEKHKMFHALENFPCIKKKPINIKWINDKRSSLLHV